MKSPALATGVLFAALAVWFFTQDPIEARHRPWTGPHVAEDGWYYYYYLRSAMIDGDLDLDNEYRDIGNWYGFGRTRTGRPYNPFGIGPALFWTPGFLAGHAIAALEARARGGGVVDGMTAPEQAGALFTSVLAAAAAFWIAFRLASRYVPARAAWLGTAIAFLGGPIVWYTVYSASMPHALESMCGAAFLAELLPFRERTPRGAVRLGAIGGAMALVRPQLVALFALLLLGDLCQRGSRRSAVIAYACAAAVALVVFLPQLLVWKHVYGSFVVVPQGSGFLRLTDSMWVDTLFSSRNGLFTTTPILWFVMPGLYLAFRRDPALGVTLVAAMFIQAFVNGAAFDWWGGGAFGGRRFAATFPVWALALSFLIARVMSSRPVAAVVAVVVAGPLVALQGYSIGAHHDHRLPWETTVPFDERVRIATGWQWPGYTTVGNPFAFPANAIFALRHGVPITRYDRAVGPYLLDERLPATIPVRASKRVDTVSFADPSAAAFLGRGFVQAGGAAVLRDSAGELFVPLNRPGSLDIEIEASGAVGAWTFNMHPVSGARFHVESDWIERGVNVLHVDGTGLTIRRLTLIEGRDWPPRDQ